MPGLTSRRWRMVQKTRGGGAALICGSVAYDTILQFPDRFKSHILPDKIHILNVSFLVPEMRREFGGCAANIAYSLRLLGDRAMPMATAGHDFAPYRERMGAQGITARAHQVVDGTFTAQAFITTDLDDNQITAFHPGAMQHAHLNRVSRRGRRHRARDRGAGRPAGHDRACGAVCRRENSLHFRSRPGHAHVRRRGARRASSPRRAGWRSMTTNGACCSKRPA